MSISKRIITFILTLCMTVVYMPIQAYAEDAWDEADLDTQTDELEFKEDQLNVHFTLKGVSEIYYAYSTGSGSTTPSGEWQGPISNGDTVTWDNGAGILIQGVAGMYLSASSGQTLQEAFNSDAASTSSEAGGATSVGVEGEGDCYVYISASASAPAASEDFTPEPTPKGKRVVDKVSYKNLIPGETYVMKGYFVDRKTGKKVKKSDGITKFVPKESEGTVNVTLNVAKASGDIVAYEYCYIRTTQNDAIKDTLVGKHDDKSDKKQTLKYSAPDTGDNGMIFFYSGLMILAAVSLVIMRKRIH